MLSHLIVFLFKCSGDHRNLHSFPTRRSSDLVRADTGGARRSQLPLPGCSALRKRSEEHTSELQSRPHLVCRLLLEKKKNRPLPTPQPHVSHALSDASQLRVTRCRECRVVSSP